MSSSLQVQLKNSPGDSYPVMIGRTLAGAAAAIAQTGRWHRYFVITDGNVRKLYAREFSERLNSLGAPSRLFSVPPGEKSKTRAVKAALEDRLIRSGAGRDSVIIALGGGVVGDLAGFVASTLFRGIDYIQIPTTLLAQVDSSVGGKVGVDHPAGKNLIGAFHQPRMVVIDVKTLRTLKEGEFRNGIAEVIKYGAILDSELFTVLENDHRGVKRREPRLLSSLIRRCCELKKTVVEADERESGVRRVLNFGHTIGHAIESLTGYRIPHGRAVAIGMAAEAKLSVRLCSLPPGSYSRLESLLHLYGLPSAFPRSLHPKEVFRATETDKKARSGRVLYTLLGGIGQAKINVPLSPEEALEAYLP